MTQQHPITPPTELVRQWCDESVEYNEKHYFHQISIAARAAQWGADQELEACCEWLEIVPDDVFLSNAASRLRAARRPKPPSLKQQALDALKRHQSETWCEEMDADIATIRRALEALPDD